jgi:hypothetical protein
MQARWRANCHLVDWLRILGHGTLLVPDPGSTDDASTRSMLKWSNEDWMKNNNTTEKPTTLITKGPNKGKLQARPNKGRLPSRIPEPRFVADPNHRKKVLTGELHELLKQPVAKQQTLTKNDVTRIGKNFGYMIRNLQHLNNDDNNRDQKPEVHRCR